MNKIRSALGWIAQQRLGRDALVVLGIIAIASGVESAHPGHGRTVAGALVLYVALWHGPVVARLYRPPGKE